MKTILLFSTIAFPILALSQTPGFRIETTEAPKQYYEVAKTVSENVQNKINELNGQPSSTQTTKRITRLGKRDIAYFETDEWNQMERIKAFDSVRIHRRDSMENALKANPLSFSNTRYAEVKDSIQKYNDTIKINDSKKDSLYQIYLTDFISQRKFVAGFGEDRATAFFDVVYGEQKKNLTFGQTSGGAFTDKSGALYTEILAHPIGPVRVSIGLTVSYSNSTDSVAATQDEAYTRLISTGGNGIIKLEYPLVFWHTNDFRRNLILTMNGGLAGDVPAFNSTSAVSTGNVSYGFNLYADISSKYNEKTKRPPLLKAFATYSVMGYSGTKGFQNNLGIGRSNFLYGQLSIGIIASQSFKFSLIIGTFSSEPKLRNKEVIFGGQVLPTN